MATQKQFQAASEIVTTAIRTDAELYTAFQANIAMAFVDSARWNQAKKNKKGRPISWTDIREIANEAADYFLKQWTAARK